MKPLVIRPWLAWTLILLGTFALLFSLFSFSVRLGLREAAPVILTEAKVRVTDKGTVEIEYEGEVYIHNAELPD